VVSVKGGSSGVNDPYTSSVDTWWNRWGLGVPVQPVVDKVGADEAGTAGDKDVFICKFHGCWNFRLWTSYA
jgi:hypothetical protein